MLSTFLVYLRPPGKGRDLGVRGRLLVCGLSSLHSPQCLGFSAQVKESLFRDVSGLRVHVALLGTSRDIDTGKTASQPWKRMA